MSKKLFVLASLSAASLVSGSALAVEKYTATVNDGTQQVIRPSAKAAPEAREEFLEDITPSRKISAKSSPRQGDGISDAGEARRARATHEDRINEVEQAKVEKKAAEDAAPVEAAAPVELPDELPALAPADGIEMTSDEASQGPKKEEAVEAVQPAEAADPLALRVNEKKVVKAEVAKKPQTGTFDQVPDKKIGEVAQRLKYANEILKRWGRAYDYRTTTLKEFKKILSELESAEEKQTAVN